MKNRKFWLVLLVMVLAFGIVGCKNEDDDDAFAGTWVMTEDGNTMKIVAADGSFTVSMGGGMDGKGTYTVSGNNVSITFTQINTGSGWEAFPEGGDDLPPKNITGTISGNSIIFAGMTFIKQ